MTIKILIKRLRTIEKRNYYFYLFLLVYTSVILFLSNILVLSIDEPFSLNTTSNSLSKVISLSYHFEGQPPAYFIILALWRKADDGIFFARLLSVVFIFLSTFFLNKLSKLIFEKIYTKWILVIFLLNPYTVWASLEIRLYSMLIFLTILAVYTFYLSYFYDQKRMKVIFFLIGLLGVYTQYYFVFVIISLSFILLLFSKGYRNFIDYCLLSFCIAVLFMPNLLFINEQFNLHNSVLSQYTIYDQVKSIISTPLKFIIPFVNISHGKLLVWILRISIIIILLYSLRYIYGIKKENLDFQKLSEVVIPAFSIPAFLTVVYLMTNLIYTIHYMTIAFPFYFLLLSTFGIFKERYKILIFSIIALYYCIILSIIYTAPFIKVEDHKSLAKYIRQIEQPNEPILFHDKNLVLTFKHYYTGINNLFPLTPLNFNSNFFQDDVRDTTEFKQAIEKIAFGYNPFMLVTGNDLGFTSKRNLTNNMINYFLKKNYTITIDTTFIGNNELYNLRLRCLHKKH